MPIPRKRDKNEMKGQQSRQLKHPGKHTGKQALVVPFLALTASMMGCQHRSSIPVKAAVVIQYEQGIKLLKSGSITQAQTALETALRTDASYSPAYFALAEIQSKIGNNARSIELLETLHRVSPQTPHVMCHLAELHVSSGRFIEGLTAAKTALQAEPDCPLANTEYALALAEAGETDEVVSTLQVAHRLIPQNERVALLLAQMLARAGKTDEAWKILESLPAKSAISASSITLRGWMLAEYGHFGKRDDKAAVELLDQALKVSPEDGPANLEKGRILLRFGKPSEALACLQTAASAMEPNSELLLATAKAQTRLKNPSAARMTQSAHAFEQMVNSLYSARQRYLKAPNDRNNLVRLARLEAASGNAQDAQTLLTRVLQQDPNDKEALRLMTSDENDSSSPRAPDTATHNRNVSSTGRPDIRTGRKTGPVPKN